MESIISFLWYFLKANVVLAVLGGFYLLALRKISFYVFNRVYIILAFAAMLILPLVEFPFDIGRDFLSDNATTNITILPVAISYAPNIEVASSPWWLQWQYGLVLLLGLGIIIYAVQLLAQLASLYFFARKTLVRQVGEHKYNVSNQLISPFSFFSFICVNPSLYTEQELNEVLAHERAHVRQLHSVDILLLEIFRCIFWINPFIHLLRREARQNLEYLADRQVVRMGFGAVHYQYTLLKVADSKILPVIVSEFRMSNLKKRIVMMNKPKASKIGLIRYSLVIPLLGFLWLFAAPAQAQEPDKNKEAEANLKEQVPQITVRDSIMGKALIYLDGVEVSRDNLKQLNPDTIEFISVLKDKTAISAYGEKGKNGVILITTKKDGDNSKKSNVIVYQHKPNKDEKEDKAEIRIVSSNRGDSPSTLPENILYLLDGEEISSSEFSKLDANRIEAISILKDKTAVEKYGDKAKDGAILITTKKENTFEGSFVPTQDFTIERLEQNNALKTVYEATTTMSGSPLFVVDGAIASSDLMKSLESDKIESITVLKDEAAAAVYGEDAKDGVILITTKKKK